MLFTPCYLRLNDIYWNKLERKAGIYMERSGYAPILMIVYYFFLDRRCDAIAVLLGLEKLSHCFLVYYVLTLLPYCMYTRTTRLGMARMRWHWFEKVLGSNGTTIHSWKHTSENNVSSKSYAKMHNSLANYKQSWWGVVTWNKMVFCWSNAK